MRLLFHDVFKDHHHQRHHHYRNRRTDGRTDRPTDRPIGEPNDQPAARRQSKRPRNTDENSSGSGSSVRSKGQYGLWQLCQLYLIGCLIANARQVPRPAGRSTNRPTKRSAKQPAANQRTRRSSQSTDRSFSFFHRCLLFAVFWCSVTLTGDEVTSNRIGPCIATEAICD